MAEQLVNAHAQDAIKEDSQSLSRFTSATRNSGSTSCRCRRSFQPVLCRVPMAPDYVEGIRNLRGTVLPVIDTEPALGCRARPTPMGRVFSWSTFRARRPVFGSIA